MKTQIGLAMAALLPLAASGASTQVSSNVRVDVLESVPIRELWNTAGPMTAESGDAIADYRVLDEEARAREGKWIGCAIVMIGTRDLGVKPVAVRIWSARPCKLLISGEASENPSRGAKFDVGLGFGEPLKIAVSRDLAVTMNGRLLGRIED